LPEAPPEEARKVALLQQGALFPPASDIDRRQVGGREGPFPAGHGGGQAGAFFWPLVLRS
jgi:hypothetical protein